MIVASKPSNSSKSIGGAKCRPSPFRASATSAAFRNLGLVPALAAALWAAALQPSAAVAADNSIWQLIPYQVQVYLSVAPEPSLGPRLEADLKAALAERIEAVIGPAWNVAISPPPAALDGAMLRGLENLSSKQVLIPLPEIDKILLVAVTPIPGGIRVAARDFDARTHMLSTTVTRPVWQFGSLCDAAMDALLTAFAPMAKIDRMDKDVAFLRAKASALPLGDRRLTLFREGDVLRPVIRYSDRGGGFLRASPAMWSFCLVEKVSPEEVRGRIHTGARSEINMRRRGRSEQLLLRVVPVKGTTLLVLQSRIEPKKPLGGYDVYAYPPGKKNDLVRLGRTDPQGRLSVGPCGDLLRVLLVRSGNEVLTRLPIVPGLEPSETAPISNDDYRLGAEGFIMGLQAELVDVFARRKIFIMRIHACLDAKQFEKAAELFDELRRLPTGEQFTDRIDKEQELLATNDPSVQRKINTLFGDTRKIIDKQIDSREIEEVDQDIRSVESGGERKAGDAKPPENKPVENKDGDKKDADKKDAGNKEAEKK